MSKQLNCEYCEHDGEYCEADVPDHGETFVCTRAAGHDGEHAACGITDDEHPIATHPQGND